MMTRTGVVFSCLIAAASATSSAPAFAQSDDFCILPICEMQETVDEFKALREDRRYSFIEQYAQDWAFNEDVASAENLVTFVEKVKALLLAEKPVQDRVLTQVKFLADQSYEQVANFAPISANKLVPSFRALQLQTSRFRVIRAWIGRVSSISDVAELRKLRDFFAIARDVSVAATDEEYVGREAVIGIELVNARIIAVSPEAPSITLPIADQNAALAQFLVFDKPTRFIVLKNLADDYAGSPESAKLASLIDFGRRVLEALRVGDANTDVAQITQAELLVSQSLFQIVRNDDASAQDLAKYYGQFQVSASRYAVLTFWNEKLNASDEIALLKKLVQFFGLAKNVSIQLQDEEFVSREAARLETATNLKLVSLAPAPVINMPIALEAAVAQFKTMLLFERSLLIDKLIADYAQSTDAVALVSIFKFGKAIDALIVEAGADQASILAANKALVLQTVDLLNRNKSLTAEELITYYKEYTVQQQRLAVINYWGAVVDGSTSRAELQNLIKYFGLARRHSNAVEDEAFVVREIQRNEQKARAKLTSLGTN